jgi:2-methylcitrate dehydratase PrpD
MKTEMKLARFVVDTPYEALPAEGLQVARRMLLATVGTAIGGVDEEGCAALRRMQGERGGKPEATVLVTGERLPAPHAAMVNGVMCRALDYCDAMAPGVHLGSSLMPAVLAAAELAGGIDGRAFMSALTLGAEVGARMNLTERAYGGLDPTGVAGIFGATAGAARVLGLNERQALNALALAFNRCGGSFQSNVDGSLAVRLIQGWVAEMALDCVLLAQAGLTGPVNFIEGVYGYINLYARGEKSSEDLLAGLWDVWQVRRTMFKKYPSCGLTQGGTELALRFTNGCPVDPATVRAIEMRLPPYAHRLVGHDFKVGDNPRVNAQFSMGYCVANAMLRGSATLAHFTAQAIDDPAVREFIHKIESVAQVSMDARGHTAVDMRVIMADGREECLGLDHAPGFPDNPLSDAMHAAHFMDCLAYARRPHAHEKGRALIDMIEGIDELPDVRTLVAAINA